MLDVRYDLPDIRRHADYDGRLRVSLCSSALLPVPTTYGTGCVMVRSDKGNKFSPVGGHVQATAQGRRLLEDLVDAQFRKSPDIDLFMPGSDTNVNRILQFFGMRDPAFRETDMWREWEEEAEINPATKNLSDSYNLLYTSKSRIGQHYVTTVFGLAQSISRSTMGQWTLYGFDVYRFSLPEQDQQRLRIRAQTDPRVLVIERPDLRSEVVPEPYLPDWEGALPHLEGSVLAEAWEQLAPTQVEEDPQTLLERHWQALPYS